MLCKCYFNKLFLKKKKEERKCVKREDVVFSVKYFWKVKRDEYWKKFITCSNMDYW